jgi:AbrB family looped-hinge helix DNA binding protein
MRVSKTGQVTIPAIVRKKMNLSSEEEIDFVEENGRFYIIKNEPVSRFKKVRGAATAQLTTDEIMNMTRER